MSFMQMKLSKEKFDSLYEKARKSLFTCIHDEENEFLREEVGVPWESVVVIDGEVKVTFFETRTVIVYLQLYVAGEQIGEYTYCEDEKGVPQDDSFVLY